MIEGTEFPLLKDTLRDVWCAPHHIGYSQTGNGRGAGNDVMPATEPAAPGRRSLRMENRAASTGPLAQGGSGGGRTRRVSGSPGVPLDERGSWQQTAPTDDGSGSTSDLAIKKKKASPFATGTRSRKRSIVFSDNRRRSRTLWFHRLHTRIFQFVALEKFSPRPTSTWLAPAMTWQRI